MRWQGTRARAAAVAVALAGLIATGLATDSSVAETAARSVPEVESLAQRTPWTIEPYTGLGAWVDVYDWTMEFTNGLPAVGPDQIDDMADAGVQTVFVQLGHDKAATDELEADRFAALVDRAHERGLRVVGWYLPMLVDPVKDLRRILVGRDLRLDGLAIDIEARTVADVAVRSQRLLELSADLRAAVGDQAIGAITPSAVHLQVVNTDFWPDFPWTALAATYDVLLPMTYWSLRLGDLHAGERYVGENIDRIRASTGQEDPPIHPIGGIADGITVPDLEGMVRAIEVRGAIGGSLYDWRTSTPAQWKTLGPLRRPPP